MTQVWAQCKWFQSAPPRGRRLRERCQQRAHGGRFNPRLHAGGDVPGERGPRWQGRFQSAPPRGRRPTASLRATRMSRFNPRLHAGGDLRLRLVVERLPGFQSAPPRGRRPQPFRAAARTSRFQSAPPRGRRQADLDGAAAAGGFNPRLHAGGDSSRSAPSSGRTTFQSAPPRGRRLERPGAEVEIDPVSIRASTREATPEVDREIERVAVSIRASTREATRGSPRRFPAPASFNPRLHAGGDSRVSLCRIATSMFQSAPPRGRRPAILPSANRRVSFNPRLHAGGDVDKPPFRNNPLVSIRASTREATRLRHDASDPEGVSIRASTREATGRARRSRRRHAGFQSAPPRGRRPPRRRSPCPASVVSIRASTREATGGNGLRAFPVRGFNPRLHAGGDPTYPVRKSSGTGFNPRLHAGGDFGFSIGGRSSTCFNPRLHAGGDHRVALVGKQLDVSIRASTREATSVGGILRHP